MCSPEVQQLRIIVEHCMDGILAGRPVLKQLSEVTCTAEKTMILLQWIDEGR